MQSPAIALENVVKRFDDGAPVLDGDCLTVAPREFLTVIGASGAGKTTLLRMINRLLVRQQVIFLWAAKRPLR